MSRLDAFWNQSTCDIRHGTAKALGCQNPNWIIPWLSELLITPQDSLRRIATQILTHISRILNNSFLKKKNPLCTLITNCLGSKAPCTLGWASTEGTWLYCDYFTWCLSCAVVVLACCVMCVRVSVICILVFTVFCTVCTVFLYCFVYVYLFLFVLSVLV
jgi:hypothetical protein